MYQTHPTSWTNHILVHYCTVFISLEFSFPTTGTTSTMVTLVSYFCLLLKAKIIKEICVYEYPTTSALLSSFFSRWIGVNARGRREQLPVYLTVVSWRFERCNLLFSWDTSRALTDCGTRPKDTVVKDIELKALRATVVSVHTIRRKSTGGRRAEPNAP